MNTNKILHIPYPCNTQDSNNNCNWLIFVACWEKLEAVNFNITVPQNAHHTPLHNYFCVCEFIPIYIIIFCRFMSSLNVHNLDKYVLLMIA